MDSKTATTLVSASAWSFIRPVTSAAASASEAFCWVSEFNSDTEELTWAIPVACSREAVAISATS